MNSIPHDPLKHQHSSLPLPRYHWREWTKVVNPDQPQRVREPFASELRPGSKPTKIDLTYKASGAEEWLRAEPCMALRVNRLAAGYMWQLLYNGRARRVRPQFAPTVPPAAETAKVCEFCTLCLHRWARRTTGSASLSTSSSECLLLILCCIHQCAPHASLGQTRWTLHLSHARTSHCCAVFRPVRFSCSISAAN